MSEELDWSGLEQATAGIEFDKIKGAIPEPYKPTVESVKDFRGLIDGFANAQKLIGRKETEYKSELEKLTGELNSFKNVNIEDYELKTDKIQLADETVKAINGTFAKAKLPKSQAQAVFADLMELQASQLQAEQQKQQEYYANQAKERELKYGDKLPATDNAIKTLVNKLAGDNEELKKGFEVLLKDNAYFDAFSKVASDVLNDNPAGPLDRIKGTYKTAEQRLEALKQDPAYLGHYVRNIGGNSIPITEEERASARELARQLYVELYGNN